MPIVFVASERLTDDKQWLTKFDGLPVLNQDCCDNASFIRLDLVEQLHRLDDAQSISAIYGLTNIHKCFGTR